jgi:membrane-associated phospholipid phosphatase
MPGLNSNLHSNNFFNHNTLSSENINNILNRFVVKYYFLSLFIFFTLTFFSDCTYSQSPYNLETGREAILLGGGLGLGVLSLHLGTNIESLNFNELQNLSRKNVNAFDRGATYNWSEDASIISDYLLNFMIISPVALLTSDKVRNDFGTFSIMYLENLFLSFAVVHSSKILTKRNRPYLYNSNVPLKYKTNRTSRLSFFSGHSTHAFSSAVFLSSVYAEYYPDSKWKTYIWGISLLSASLTGYFRYSSGDHFPTDIIVGAVVGSAIGYLIPLIHKVDKKDESLSVTPTKYQNLFSLQIIF